MKDIRPGLYAFLLADGPIGVIVESSVSAAQGGCRVFPVKLPQGVKKASLVVTRISGQGDYTMAGPSGYTRPRYQIDAWAPTLLEAGNLASAVKDAIDGFKGAIGTGANAVDVQGVFCVAQREQYDDIVQMYGVSRDYFIHHGEL